MTIKWLVQLFGSVTGCQMAWTREKKNNQTSSLGCFSVNRSRQHGWVLSAIVLLVRPQLKKGILWPISLARVRVIDWNCDLHIRFHCRFEKLLWFTSCLSRWSVHNKLSRGMERNNAVCVSPRISFWTKSQYKNIVWLPAFKSIGHWPEFFTTAISLWFC